MADQYGGFGSGLAEGLQLAQALQLGEVDKAQKEVNLQQSQIRLDATRQLHAFATGKTFQEAVQNPQTATQAMYEYAHQALADGFVDQATAIYDVNANKEKADAYAAEQRSLSASRTIGELGEAAANTPPTVQGVQSLQQWVSAFHPDLLQNPQMKQFISTLTPSKLSMIPGYTKTVQQSYLAQADAARAKQADTEARRAGFEDERDKAEADESEARADALRKQGAEDQLPTKAETQTVVDRLKADYPMADTDPIIEEGGFPDTTARRENREAPYNAAAQQIASAAKQYVKQGLSWDKALDRAMAEAKAHGALQRFQRRPAPAPASDAWTVTPLSSQ